MPEPAAAAATLAGAVNLPDTLRGGFLLGCLVLAGLLVLTHAITAIWPQRTGPTRRGGNRRELESAAAGLAEAALELEEAVAANREAVEANLEAATAAGASTTAGVEALLSLRSNDNIVRLLGNEEPDALDYLTRVDLDQADATDKAEKAERHTEKAGEQTEKVRRTVDEVEKKVKAGRGASFMGTVEGISERMPMVGGAILLVVLGGMGADLITFSIG